MVWPDHHSCEGGEQPNAICFSRCGNATEILRDINALDSSPAGNQMLRGGARARQRTAPAQGCFGTRICKSEGESNRKIDAGKLSLSSSTGARSSRGALSFLGLDTGDDLEDAADFSVDRF